MTAQPIHYSPGNTSLIPAIEAITHEERDGGTGGWEAAAEAMQKLWDFIFSNSAGEAYEEITDVNAQIIIRNFFVVTLMVRPDRMNGAQSLRQLAHVLKVSHETLSRIQLRLSDQMSYHARSQRAQPRDGTVADRLRRNKGGRKVG